MAQSILNVQVALDVDPTGLEADIHTNHKATLQSMLAKLTAILGGLSGKGGRIKTRIDSVTPIQSSLTVTCTQADFTAGDRLIITTPWGEVIVLTAKASGAVAANGEFDAVTNDNTTAANLNAALAAYALAKLHVVATVATNVVTIKPVKPGARGNDWKARVSITAGTPMALSGSGAFSGGKDALDEDGVTNTIVQASLVDNTDTLSFGGTAGVVLTWKTTPSGENQVAIGASDTAAASNLVAKINAHSVLGKIFVATSSVGVVTIKYKGDPRIGRLIGLTEAGNGQTLGATHFGGSTTLALIGDVVDLRSGL